MATNIPKFKVTNGEDIGNELFFLFPDILSNERTYIDSDMTAAASSISGNGVNFFSGQYIVIGQPGNLKTEIVQINGTPSATAIPITTTSFAHNRGDIVRFIPYNQIVAEWSASQTGSYTALAAIPIRADSMQTYLQQVSDPTTYWYRFRFQNSTSGLFSQYSDVQAATGYGDNTIWSVKQRALREIGEELSDLVTDADLNAWIMEGRRMADQNPAIMRWSFRTTFGNVTGMLLAGQWRVAIPANLRDPNSPKNVLSIRCANQNRPVIYQDRVRFNQNYLNVNHSTIAVQQTSGGTTLQLASTHDFDASGAITLANNSVGDGLISIAYTGNNKNTNTLTGVTGINRTVLLGTDVWQRAVFGLPTSYTVGGDGYWYFDVPVKVDYDGMDVKDDHYNSIPAIDTDADTFDEPFYDLYVSWLKWKIKYKKANGKIDRDGDTDYKDWLTGLGNLIGQEFPGQRISFVPDIEGFLSATE